MKVKQLAVFLAVGILFALVTIATVPYAARAQGPNLLQNPGFEEGHFKQDGIAEITVPNGWRMHWSNGESQIFGGYAETARPETVVWNISGAPEHEKDVFWRDGIYTVKIFKGWAPLWAAMSQNVSGLEVGRRYRLVAPVYIDIVADYQGGQKVAPVDGRQGRVRLGASPVGAAWRDESAINYSGWWTGETISPFYQAYPTFIHEFTATAPEMTVWIEMASNYPHPNNGFFIDTVGLYALDEVDNNVSAPPPASAGDSGGGQVSSGAPPPAPEPKATPRADGSVVHIIQSGDSYWTLAIQYAETMGITPEEALVAIPELNNNPAMLRSGMELQIVPPNPEGAAPTAEASSEAEATSEGEPTAESAADSSTENASAETGGSSVVVDSGSGQSSAQQAIQQATSGSICVAAYLDQNDDGKRDENELPVAENAITLAKDGNTISTYITNGSDDLYCFEGLDTGTYQVQIYPSADYSVSSDDSWAIAVADGVMIPVSFALSYGPNDTAVADASAANSSASGETATDAQTSPAAPAVESTGSALSDNLGLVVIGAAGVLALLAIVGVVLLRRG